MRGVCANNWEFCSFAKLFKNCAIARIKAKPLLRGNSATLVVNGNILLAINIALGETVTEFSAVVRTQYRY